MRMMPLHASPRTPIVIMPSMIAGYPQRVRLPGEVADPELAGDHLGGDQRNPGHAHADRKTREDVRQRARQDHVPEQLRLVGAEAAAGPDQHAIQRMHAVMVLRQDRKERTDEGDEDDGGLVVRPQQIDIGTHDRGDWPQDLDTGHEQCAQRSYCDQPAERHADGDAIKKPSRCAAR